ncbi:EamA/RhaT family transporter [Pedobacter gandavensis]|uniref:EamA family transporter n=1 Tax=Pedobacter gandavensis TaxID=2679963 RepID=UPI00292F2BA7|nr:EamA/RhaT family transporter [Pedobacter gandavensis]
MIYLIISIFCSVTVAALLKLARRYKINILQAITWNYLFAIALSFFFFKPGISELTAAKISPIYLGLGVLLPLVFWFLGASIRSIGIAKTDIAQRLSLFISILAAYFLFGDQFNTLKILGLCFGFTAIIFTLYRKPGNLAKSNSPSSGGNWIYPLLVFFGFGFIDILFKQIAQIKDLPYTSSLILTFAISFILSLLAILYLALIKKQKLELVNLACGAVLGLFNFGNILFYLKAHRAMAENPSTVFAAMNIGVIILGSFVGILLFKEKLNKLNYIGLALALIAIIFITLSQFHAI